MTELLQGDWAPRVRKQLKQGLLLANTLAGGRVEAERRDPIAVHPVDAANELPLLCVYVFDAIAEGRASPVYKTTARIVVDAWVAGLSSDAGPDGEPQSAEEAAGDLRDQLVAQVLDATVFNLTWAAQFEQVERYRVIRGVAENDRQLVLGCGKVEIDVRFSSQLELGEPSRIFEKFVIDAVVAPAPSQDAVDLAIIAEPPQEAPP